MNIFNSKWPAILWSVIVFIALVISVQGFEQEKVKLFPHSDKIIHFTLFGVFTWLWIEYIKSIGITQRFAKITILLISVIYGVGMEFVQMLPIVHRDFSIGDMIADAAGSLAAFWWHMKKPR